MSASHTPRLDQAEAVAESLADGSYDQPEGECDLVMKGGITSGVVYPLAACELAKRNRFVNLGGSSAGAIAAAVVAAAEFDRDGGGFNRLATVPAEIGPTLPLLFAPGRNTVTAHAALMEMLDTSHSTGARLRRVWKVLRRSQRATYVKALVVGLLVAVAIALVGSGLPTSVVDALQFAFLVVLIGVVAVVAATLWALKAEAAATVAGMTDQGFGICVGSARSGPEPKGGPQDGDGPGYLTDWIAAKVDWVAGLDRPLTFGDLATKNLSLQVMTTDLTHGVPRIFPFADPAMFMFDPEELAEYFPPPVIQQLCAHAPEASRDGTRLTTDTGRPLFRLPSSEHIPVVIAARISLSFPALISAVPLWTIEENRTKKEDRLPIRCWFTDGGLTSNFPLQLFDSMWPQRPTFALDLQPYHPDYPGQDVYYGGEKGRMPRVKRIAGLGGFAAALLNTMQYWSDDQQARMPGFRDRIVEVRLSKDEGGMNLRMTAETVAVVAAKGQAGAAAIDPRSPADPPPGPDDPPRFDMAAHRMARLATSLGHIQEATERLRDWYPQMPDGSAGFRDLLGSAAYADAIAAMSRGETDGSTAPWDGTAAQDLTDRLVDFAGPQPDLTAFVGTPKGRLRVAPDS